MIIPKRIILESTINLFENNADTANTINFLIIAQNFNLGLVSSSD